MGPAKEEADTIVEHLGIVPKDDLELWITVLNLDSKTDRQEEYRELNAE